MSCTHSASINYQTSSIKCRVLIRTCRERQERLIHKREEKDFLYECIFCIIYINDACGYDAVFVRLIFQHQIT